MNTEHKKFIDTSDYATLLSALRHHHPDDQMFIGETYHYYVEEIREKRAALDEIRACQIERSVDKFIAQLKTPTSQYTEE